MKIEQLGRHILVEYYNCDKDILKDYTIIEDHMKEAAIVSFTIYGGIFMKIEQLGRHILVEYYNCDKDILKDYTIIEDHMKEAAIVSNATIVTSCFHKFNPWGVSGAVIIQESHLTIHTWPEY